MQEVVIYIHSSAFIMFLSRDTKIVRVSGTSNSTAACMIIVQIALYHDWVTQQLAKRHCLYVFIVTHKVVLSMGYVQVGVRLAYASVVAWKYCHMTLDMFYE